MHGQCLNGGGTAMCACNDERWTGDHCETEIGPNGLQCHNGGSVRSGDLTHLYMYVFSTYNAKGSGRTFARLRSVFRLQRQN